MKVKRIIKSRVIRSSDSIEDAVDNLAAILFKKYGREMIDYAKTKNKELDSEDVYEYLEDVWFEILGEIDGMISDQVNNAAKKERSKK